MKYFLKLLSFETSKKKKKKQKLAIMAFLRVLFLFSLLLSIGSCTTLYATIVSSLDFGAQQAVCSINPANGQQQNTVMFPSSLGGILPDAIAVLPNNIAVITTVAAENCLVWFSLTTGKVLQQKCSNILVFDNLESFNSTLYFNAYNETLSKNFIYSTLATPSAPYNVVLPVPGVVQVAISTASPSLFFLTVQTGGGIGNALVTIDVATRRILYTVNVDPGIEILVWSAERQCLLAWVATETYAAQLVQLDYTTGRVVRSWVSSVTLSANGGSSVVVGDVVYASLLQYQNGNAPWWTVTNLTSGTWTRYPTDPNAIYPWLLNLVAI